RIALGVHYPLDIVAGALLGALAVLAVLPVM
ncbi:MAG: phosphatase PAP2 family protein, partial [Shewanella sp.]